MRRLIIVCSLAAGLVLGVGGTACPGETNGRGEPIPGAQMASSDCAFSGQDLPDAEEDQPPELRRRLRHGAHVQTYGKYVSHGLKGAMPSPGDACRGNLGG